MSVGRKETAKNDRISFKRSGVILRGNVQVGLIKRADSPLVDDMWQLDLNTTPGPIGYYPTLGAAKSAAEGRLRKANSTKQTTTLWRPVGPEELKLVEAAGMKAFPRRLPSQPIFYPVVSEDYAIKIARDWNVAQSGCGHVTRFEVLNTFLAAYPVQEAGGRALCEYWIPAEDLPAFNEAIVGLIEVTASFGDVPGVKPTSEHPSEVLDSLRRP